MSHRIIETRPDGSTKDVTHEYLTPEDFLTELSKEKLTGIEAFNLLTEEEQREIMFFLGVFDKEDIPDNWWEILNEADLKDEHDMDLADNEIVLEEDRL